MENYEQFLRRIDEFEQPVFTLPNEYFSINPSLKYKVDIFNKFRPFYGDTVIFELSDEIKAQAGGMIDALYREAGDCFSELLIAGRAKATGKRMSPPMSPLFKNGDHSGEKTFVFERNVSTPVSVFEKRRQHRRHGPPAGQPPPQRTKRKGRDPQVTTFSPLGIGTMKS